MRAMSQFRLQQGPARCLLKVKLGSAVCQPVLKINGGLKEKEKKKEKSVFKRTLYEG